jgi:hypothetical protein
MGRSPRSSGSGYQAATTSLRQTTEASPSAWESQIGARLSALTDQLFPPAAFLSRLSGLSFGAWLGKLRGHHHVGLADQVFQLLLMQDIQTLQHHPLLAAYIGHGCDSFQLKHSANASPEVLKANSLRHRVQAQRDKDLPAHFETESFAPLQVLFRIRKGKTVAAYGFNVHGSRERSDVMKNLLCSRRRL